MNCIKCYKEIPDDAKFCPHCGAPQPEAGPVHAEAGAAAESVTTAEDAAQQTENTAQQTESAAQQTRDPGYQYQQSGPVYQSEPTPIYQQPVNHEPVNGTPYLVLSIVLAVLSALCCCNILSLAFSIVAIVYSAKIGKCVNEGDYAGAESAAKTAKIWIIVAFAVGIVGMILSIVALGGLADLAYYYY